MHQPQGDEGRDARRRQQAYGFRAVLLVMLQTVLVGLSGLTVQFAAMGTPGCSPDCDYSLLTGAGYTNLIGSVALLFGTAAALFLLRRAERAQLVAPVIGIAATVILWATCYSLVLHSLRG